MRTRERSDARSDRCGDLKGMVSLANGILHPPDAARTRESPHLVLGRECATSGRECATSGRECATSLGRKCATSEGGGLGRECSTSEAAWAENAPPRWAENAPPRRAAAWAENAPPRRAAAWAESAPPRRRLGQRMLHLGAITPEHSLAIGERMEEVTAVRAAGSVPRPNRERAHGSSRRLNAR
jgi:hypothetical protein